MGSASCLSQARSFCCLFLPNKTEEKCEGPHSVMHSVIVCLRLWPGEVEKHGRTVGAEQGALSLGMTRASMPVGSGVRRGFAIDSPCLCSVYCVFNFNFA